mgnify:CR=1 FL=1
MNEEELTLAEWTKRIDPQGKWAKYIPDLEKHPHFINTELKMNGDEFSLICSLYDE